MSDQDSNMFDEVTVQPTNEVPEFLAEFVGDGKKYKTTEDALKSVPNAQAHIDKLEQELAELKTGTAQDELMNDIEKRLMEKMQGTVTPDPVTPEVTTQQPADQAPVIKIDDVVNQVKSMLTQEQYEKQQISQQKSVVEAAINAWGGEAEKNLYGKAAEVGMDAQSIDALAATNPQAALKILGINAKPQGSVSTQGSLNTQATTYTSNLVKPTLPTNAGDDKAFVEYIRQMAEYEAAGGKF